MEEVGEVVLEESNQTLITQNKFNDIETAIDKSKIIVDNISNNFKNIETNNEKIVLLTQNLAQIAEKNAETTEDASKNVESQTLSINDISSASLNLAEIATELQCTVSNFKL